MYIKCYGIGHEHQDSYKDWPEKCEMGAEAYPASKHHYGVHEFTKRKVKLLCIHIVAQYANCQGSHSANSG